MVYNFTAFMKISSWMLIDGIQKKTKFEHTQWIDVDACVDSLIECEVDT